jgi:uncharacterized C2H2 Zn-finger protein
MSKLTKFKTAPIPNADEAFNFLVYGDMGVSPAPRANLTAQYSINEVENRNATFVVHIGDISYAVGSVRSLAIILTLKIKAIDGSPTAFCTNALNVLKSKKKYCKHSYKAHFKKNLV